MEWGQGIDCHRQRCNGRSHYLLNQMKSVCILLQNHYEIDIWVRRKAEALVAAGYIVDVLALQSSFSKSKNYTLCGVNVWTVALGKKRGSLLRYLYEYVAFFLWASFRLSVRMRKRRVRSGGCKQSSRLSSLRGEPTLNGAARRLSSTCTRLRLSSISRNTEFGRTLG